MNYNIKNITNLLSNAFNDTDLTTFCQSYFWEVFNNFSAGQNKALKISALIDHCQRNMQIDRLLELMKVENPAQYERFLPYEKNVEQNKVTTKQSLLNILQTGDLEKFVNEVIKLKNNENEDKIISFSARYNLLQESFNTGRLTKEEYKVETINLIEAGKYLLKKIFEN